MKVASTIRPLGGVHLFRVVNPPRRGDSDGLPRVGSSGEDVHLGKATARSIHEKR